MIQERSNVNIVTEEEPYVCVNVFISSIPEFKTACFSKDLVMIVQQLLFNNFCKNLHTLMVPGCTIFTLKMEGIVK